MKENYYCTMYSIMLWCLLSAKAYPNASENQSVFLCTGNPVFEIFNQTCDEFESGEIEKYIIAFKSPFSYLFDNDTRWEIVNTDTNTNLKSGTGAINAMVFEIPGNYLINVFETIPHDATCEHTHFPETILLEVSPVKMEFDFSTIQFSEKITGSQTTSHITLTVAVSFSSYDGGSKVYNHDFKTVGIKTSVIGKLKNEVILNQGTNTLEFQLEGQATKDTYISIDFVDINNQIQTYRITNKIK